ncbi:cyclase family protein [Granulicella tundricola]|uniref:Cyclase family protein n=1 Tax=Granulicella tundricola (strain ATCC BAA-1859 / DSM 23138 / MP5ACTX9) TaxID=1198114 RepID=E8X748_GRATM|nr:cyclase family protein [Granulicella tundricola]ADW71282.1 cyclase family protein [Granulicella tundricola MP5ACTX9]
MIYDLAQPLYNNGPQFPDQPPNSIRYYQRAVVKGATVERLEIMTHSGSHVDAPFHYKPQLPTISELPLSHFYGPCVGLDLRPVEACHAIDADDLQKHETLITEGVFLLLKTGWGDRRANTKEFLTDWPYMSGDGARYLVERGIKGLGIDVLSTGGYPDEHAEADAHLELLGAQKLLLEDIHIPDELLDGRHRHFAAFPILIANAGGSWVRPVVWDTGDLDGAQPATELRTELPPSVAGLIALERDTR